LTDEEKKYKKVISALKTLPKVKAKPNFEQKLYRKLRDVDTERMSPSVQKLTKPIEKNWIFNIFKPAFIPAVGITLALIAVIVIYLYLNPFENTTVKKESQQIEQKQDIVTKDQGTEKGKEPSVNEEQPLISQDLRKSETSGTLREQEPPIDNLETVPPSVRPEEKEEEKTIAPSLMDQKIERKETKGEDLLEGKEMHIEKKTGNIRKDENDEIPKLKNAEEKTEQQNKIDEGIFQRAVEPSLGLDKSKIKDTTKIDSMKSKKKKENERGKDTNKVIKKEINKQAEPIRQEPEGNKQENIEDNK
jgi:hypothetical protein